MAVHDARHRRQDPDGLLSPERDGVADRELAIDYHIATGNDADSDRHGIVTPDGGLMNPNHYLAVAIDYLFTHRPDWPRRHRGRQDAVSSSIIDRVVAGMGRELSRFRSVSSGSLTDLLSGSIGFGGEESAGASFLRHDGSVWTTDKDGIILALLASEITGGHGQTPSQRYDELAEKYGAPAYARVDAPATREQKARLAKLSPEQVTATELAGEPITATLTAAPGNGAPIGRSQGDDRRTRGSRRGRPAPRTCTRSMPSRSRAPTSGRGAGRRARGGE